MISWRARRRTRGARGLLAALGFAVLLPACRNEVRAAGAPTAPHVSTSLLTRAPRILADASPDLTGVERADLVLGADGIEEAIDAANLPHALVDQLDEAFVGRVDLLAHARDGRRLTIWSRHGTLVAARLDLGKPGGHLLAAEYRGAHAPRGFYDEKGRALLGVLRSRPIALRRITSRFGQRFDAFTGAPSLHRGIDYGVPRGTPVVAVGRGRVKTLGVSRAAGNFIKLAHADGYESFYLHLDDVAAGLSVGDVVEQSQTIGHSGNTGRSTGPHLHYELHLAGIPVDPLTTLPMPKAALGPMARREHLAFLKALEAIDDRRADEQDQHP